jgi:endoglucanase
LGKYLGNKAELSDQAKINANCQTDNAALTADDLVMVVKASFGEITLIPDYPPISTTDTTPAATEITTIIEETTTSEVTTTEATTTSEVTTTSETTTEETTTSETTTEETTTEPEPANNEIVGEVRANLSPQQFVAEMNAGWNLGNTLDAWNDLAGSDQKDYQESFETIDSETSWGNPKTSQAMIDAVKAKGFDFIRIPTTWHTHFIDDQFTIDPEWMDRVQEIVNYAISIDLKVILNTHHEGSVIIPTIENENYDKQWITAVWTQIGTRFQNYGDQLIFEGLNEPRTEGSTYEWQGGTSDDRAVVNHLNQTFVNVIRSLDGNNKTRFLMVPSYAAGVDNSLLPTYGAQQSGTHFEMPSDPANRVIAEIHAYTPWSFAGGGIEEGSFDQVFDSQDMSAIDSMFNQVKSCLLDKGYAVIIDEFGSRSTQQENNSTVERPYDGTSRLDWLKYYVSKANALGVPCCIWDDGGWFRQLNRTDLTWYYPEHIDTFISESFK